MNATGGSSAEKPGFWRRQFQLPSTRPQRSFDLLFGILAPFLCVCFDPTVFRSDGLMGNGFLSPFRLYGYLEIAVSAAALAYYVGTRRASPLLAGALWGGFFFALILGVIMLPLTLLGLLLIIGVFGFTPFLTAFVFFRNACRCWRDSSVRATRKSTLVPVTLGMVLILGIPACLQASAFYLNSHAMVAIQSGSDQDFARAVKTLQRTRFVISPDGIAFAYQKASDERQRERLARAFQAVTGRSVEKRLAELND